MLSTQFERKHSILVPVFAVCGFPALLIFFLALGPHEDMTHLSRSEREEYFRKASVLHKSDVQQANIVLGPQNEISVQPEAEVGCFYVEEPPSRVGYTPKFRCRLMDSAEIVRIKFSRRETVAEIAGTRLLWALGFYTDEVYPVKLRCYGCPERNPANPEPGERRMERMIPDAVMERNFNGTELAQYPDQGWSWREIETLAADAGEPRKSELNALILLAAMMQHTDSKRSQQRIGCYEGDIQLIGNRLLCVNPVLMIQDLGETFGMGATVIESYSAMYFRGWESVPVWNTAKEKEYELQHSGVKKCFANLISAGRDGLFNPSVNESGRRLLAGLLGELTDKQIAELFLVSRADKTEEKIVKNGRLRPVAIDDWVAAFKAKRRQIEEKRCTD